MSFLSEMNWFSVVVGAVCFVGVPVLSFLGWVVSGMLDDRMLKNRAAQEDALRKRGITAPAVVISARNIMERSPFGRREKRIDYEVDVQPEGRTAFRQSFQHWTERRNTTVILGQLAGEAGRKIWVTYDPNDPSQMIFEHYDEDHGKIVEQQELDKRRLEFNKLAEMNNDVRKTGEEAEAVILRAEDLNLPYPSRGSHGMRLYFDVFPKSGNSFRSDTYALIADTSMEKYSAGKKVFVRFDPLKPERTVLDTERNRSRS